MQIALSPVRMDEQVTLVRQGDILYVNGEAFDFSPLQEGATLPWGAVLSDWFPGTVERIDGELHLTIRLPHGPNAPESTRFPVPISITKDGPVDLPVYDIARHYSEGAREATTHE
ncbi:hypothetical protein [Pseudomonas urmiensis]|uniref:hypothetical protein n=1 Tax=Pseudomonas urmiensis TaxID=2745493 RepID=UPI0034D51CB9